MQDYESDTAHWKHVIQKSYLEGVGLNWSTIRNVMDMKAGYGGYILSYASHFLSPFS